jgi:acetyl esterase/lipase
MKFFKLAALSAAVVGFLMGCGGGDSPDAGSTFDLSGAPGSLVATPTTLTSFTPETFTATLTQAGAASLFQVTNAPKCNISFHYFQYGTVGGAGEKTTASGGIMVPSGTDPACSGPRPVLLYAHGTSTNKNKNMASPQDGEAALIAAMYAAHGYIVVAPNYAGYESSPLPYHPYLNLEQQAQDVVDALTAARQGFAAINAHASDKLFVSGYSQGGFVSMAAQRKLQLAGTPVTAGAHHSGPYNLGFFGDLVYSGQVNVGATIFNPLLNTSFQRTYGNIYTTPSEMYEDTFATGIETLLPSTTPLDTLLAAGKLPATFLFEGTPPAPQLALFFGTPNLIKTSYRNAVLADFAANPSAPQHPLRVAAYKNDLLAQNWTPAQPMLLCGGSADPTVFFAANTSTAKAYFTGKGVPDQAVTVLDVEGFDPTATSDPFYAAKGGFAQAKAAAGTAALEKYHGELVPPFCNVAARGYFAKF